MSNIDTAQEALPRGPMTEASGEPSRSWRNYFESRSRRLGEVISGVNLNRQSIVDLNTEVDGVAAAYIAADAVVAANATSANASLSSSLTAAFQAADTTLQANITSEASTRATADTALSTSITSLTATVGTNTASITTNSSAIATLNSSSAVYEVLVAASGGQPARIRLKAGIGGSTVEIDGNEVFFGAQTRFDTSTETFITEVGSVRSRYGTAFGSGASVVMWHGPTSVAQGSESRTNGYLAIGTNGLIYHNAAALSWGATAAEAAASNALLPLGSSIVKNALFQAPFSGTAVPPDWSDWVSGAGTFQTSPTGIGYAYLLAGGAGANAGILQTVPVAAGLKYVMAAEVRRDAGTFAGACLYMSWRDVSFTEISNVFINFATDASTSGVVSASPDGSVRYEKQVTAPTGAVQAILYAMNHFSGIGSIASSNSIYWREANLAPLRLVSEVGANITGNNTAAAITGQGNLATANNARGTTAARAASTGSWSFYANTTTNTLQVDVPSSGWTDVATLSTAAQTRGKILGPAGVSFSANNTWQEVALVDVSDVPSGGVIQVLYVDVVGQSQSGPTIGSGYSWRLTEALVSSPSSKTVIKSGGITISAGAGTDPPTVDDVVQPSAALVTVTNSGSVRYIIEVQRTSGTATIGLQVTANFIVGPS